MKHLKNLAIVAVAASGILFSGAGIASAHSSGGGDEFPILSNINELDWDNSPFCGFQIKTKDSNQETSCPVVHLENSPDSTVVIYD